MASRCSFTVDPLNNLAPASQGDTTFSVAFTSSGGATASGTFTVNIGPDSAITYTAPTGLLTGRNRALTVDLSAAATDGSYTVTCGDATGVHSRLSSVTRPDAETMPCVFAVTPRTSASQGTASFVVPFSSDGGAATTGTVSITIGPPSTIVFAAPDPALQLGINRTRVIDALDYARDGNYTITCLDPTGVDSTKLTSVTRSSAGNGCGYTNHSYFYTYAVSAGRSQLHCALHFCWRAYSQPGVQRSSRPGFYYYLHCSFGCERLVGSQQPHFGD